LLEGRWDTGRPPVLVSPAVLFRVRKEATDTIAPVVVKREEKEKKKKKKNPRQRKG
jgi:hypothetical protein